MCVCCRILNGGSKKQRKRRKKSGRKAAVTAEDEGCVVGGGVAVEKKALYVNLRDPNLIFWILQLINQLEKGFLTVQLKTVLPLI